LRREEYDRLAQQGFFDGEKVELIHGMVVRMSPIGPNHADPVDFLNELFVSSLRSRARVRVQLPFLVGEDSEPEPDVALVPPGRYRDRHPSQAFLVVEIAVTSLDHDRITKSELYGAAGVPEYWVVDVGGRVVEVRDTLVDGRYTRVRKFTDEQELHPSAFPDVAVSLKDLFGL
jgi:Uma2 family endonuclease